MALKKAVVQVPASTSNLGPGYDCLGLALRMYNRITVTRAPEGAKPMEPVHPMVEEAATAYFKRARRDWFPFHWSIEGEVPVSRGPEYFRARGTSRLDAPRRPALFDSTSGDP